MVADRHWRMAERAAIGAALDAEFAAVACRPKHRVPGLDGECAVAELVRQADLPEIGMAGGAAVPHHVDHHLIVLENPVPMGASVHPHARFVGANDP
jgi:hypothetical protein